jgi:VWFA-related protein
MGSVSAMAVEVRFRSVSAIALLALAGSQARAQSADAGNFSVDVNLVVLHATVLDKKGGFVSGLDKDDFRVLEDGKPQTIRTFSSQDVPVSVGLLVDSSGSMREKSPEVATAAGAFVRASNPEDDMFILSFNEKVSFGMGETPLISANSVKIELAVGSVPSRGKTALYDAIWDGLARLKQASNSKKVLIVVSDGGDNASSHSLSEVLKAAESSDVIIYTVGLFDEDDEDRNPGVLRKLAHSTGGEVFLPRKIPEVVEITRKIARDIRNQYTIGYVPSNEKFEPGYRTIQVTATAPNHAKCIVRTRTGYLAGPQ